MTEKTRILKNDTFRLADADAQVWYYETDIMNEANYALNIKEGRLKTKAPIYRDNRNEIFIALHRKDGPALITSKTFKKQTKWWYLDGVCYLFEVWCKYTNIGEEEITLLKMKYD